ncbi:hypothetical protein [Gemmatimonas groenlandica]|uniref:Uncharacterized protein n=1 Tax=Gemmatimonas groenlandica TaxID=2732249 RepID=A0A6M4IP92_9BACT|nr:hypothetical protein [Gemmatimonas groenlandica]QJR35835.1 hypothetical protein HKW67_10090 [Gemmatimonas groenlandica]
MKARLTLPYRWAAIAMMLAGLSRSAAACSLVAPWEINDALMIAFIGSPLADTVLAGDGSHRPIVATGHSGAGASRVAYGQRVRVDRVGNRARAALPRDTREVVLVPWDYAADCRPVAWSRSARWLPDSLSGLFRARLRPRAEWARGIPTFDITGAHFQPYRDAPRGVGVHSREPRLSAQALLSFYDALPSWGREPDTVAARDWINRIRADTALAGRYPVTSFIGRAGEEFEIARARSLRIPISGTFRLDVLVDGLASRTMFLRVGSTVASMDYPQRDSSDNTLEAPLPEGYAADAAAATAVSHLALSCHDVRGAAVSYVNVAWHSRTPANGVGEWQVGIDPGLVDVILSQEERDRLGVHRGSAAKAANDPLLFSVTRPLRVVQGATGPLRIEGVMSVPLLGVVQVRGERISREALPCSNRWGEG